MLKKWIKEYGLRYIGKLEMPFFNKENQDYNFAIGRELWYSTKQKKFMFQSTNTKHLWAQIAPGECYTIIETDS